MPSLHDSVVAIFYARDQESALMSSSNIVERFLRGEELAVAADQIENVLAMLWQAVPAERNVMRVCERNLIVQMRSPALIEQTAALVREFSKRHPARALVLALDAQSEEDGLTSYVTPLFDENIETQQNRASEQILVIASGQKAREVYALVSTFVLPDVPATFWFVQGIPSETPLLERLLEKDPRVVFDSSMPEDLGLTLARANALLEKNKHVADLNWQRLASWVTQLQEALRAPEGASLAENAEKITLLLGGEVLDEKQIGAAVLLMSWLARHGGWQLVETIEYVEGRLRAAWEKAGREIVAEIKLAEKTERELQALELTARGADEEIVLKIVRTEQAAGYVLQTTLSRNGQNVFSPTASAYSSRSIIEMLLHESEQAGRDEVYKETLALATQLI